MSSFSSRQKVALRGRLFCEERALLGRGLASRLEDKLVLVSPCEHHSWAPPLLRRGRRRLSALLWACHRFSNVSASCDLSSSANATDNFSSSDSAKELTRSIQRRLEQILSSRDKCRPSKSFRNSRIQELRTTISFVDWEGSGIRQLSTILSFVTKVIIPVGALSLQQKINQCYLQLSSQSPRWLEIYDTNSIHRMI